MSLRSVQESKKKWQKSQWKGAYVKVLGVEEDTGATILLFRAEKGSIVPWHIHPHAEELYMMSGEMKTSDGGKVGAGTYIYILAGLRHGGLTVTKEMSAFIRFSARPIWIDDDGTTTYLAMDGKLKTGKIRQASGSIPSKDARAAAPQSVEGTKQIIGATVW